MRQVTYTTAGNRAEVWRGVPPKYKFRELPLNQALGERVLRCYCTLLVLKDWSNPEKHNGKYQLHGYHSVPLSTQSRTWDVLRNTFSIVARDETRLPAASHTLLPQKLCISHLPPHNKQGSQMLCHHGNDRTSVHELHWMVCRHEQVDLSYWKLRYQQAYLNESWGSQGCGL